jgi:hypothetical protein
MEEKNAAEAASKPVKFDPTAVDVTGDQAKQFDVTRSPLTGEPETVLFVGPCPICKHRTSYLHPVHINEPQVAPRNIPMTKPANAFDPLKPITVYCDCGGAHDTPDTGKGCGAYWRLLP